MERRKFLSVLGAGAIASVAGCTSEDDGPEDRETGTTDSDGPAEAPADSDGTDDSDGDGTDDSQTGAADGDGGEDEQQVEILNHEWYEEDFSAGVRGELENVSDETLSYVSVDVFFLDSEGTQIGEGIANTSDLAAGRVWEFEAAYYDTDPERVENYEIQTDVSDF